MMCYFATLTTDRVPNIGVAVYDLNWYDYPQNVRKNIVLIIAHSQKPIYFNGLKMFHCTLEIFGKVSILFSHCMMDRTYLVV